VECGRRVEVGMSREIRRVNGIHRLFHSECADRGALRIRAEARSPVALARKRSAEAAIAAAKRRRV
jgi:hypothetical protein